jgi:hypothetical protein
MSRQTKKREAAGVVYFIREKGTGCIKIGKTTDVRGRIKGLQTGSPQGLQLLAVVPGYTEVEERLHRRFAADRVSGEWFRPSSELLAFIDGVVAAGHAADLVVAAAEVAGLKAQLAEMREELSWHQRAEKMFDVSHRGMVADALEVVRAQREADEVAELGRLDDELERQAGGETAPATERRPGAEMSEPNPLFGYFRTALRQAMEKQAAKHAGVVVG